MKTTDDKTTALDLIDKLFKAGALSIHTGNMSYVTCNDEIADITSRRELEAILVRLKALAPAGRVTKPLAATLCSVLTPKGIHLDQWLADRKLQTELNELRTLLKDYDRFGDVNANDTRLRILILKITKAHAAMLRKTLTDTEGNI